MLKKLIAPLQKILLQKKLCPACTSDLTIIKDRKPKRNDTEIVTCRCGRIFIYDKDLDLYRRALLDEIE
ncbi:hypothetical protein GF362_02825 [Candidatus Dojkabacteria bacterium]|nr:hypothetical protein [Candidatus Dojkabacteria bacterium]